MATTKFIDSHFHIWDVSDPDSDHLLSTLGGPAELHPTYSTQMYLDDMAKTNKTLIAGVFLECLPHNGVKEVAWARKKANDVAPRSIVARADLSSPTIETTLSELAGGSHTIPVVGIRQVLNWEPTWPFVPSGNLASTPEFEHGYALLQKYNLSFDLHINPYQMPMFAALAAKYPSVPVVIDHLGCPKLGGPSSDTILAAWREGMAALANAGPHIFVKISMLCYIDPNWDSPSSIVPTLVKEVVSLFGPSRIMLASNYPVDKHMGTTPERFAAGTDAILSYLDEESLQQIYCGTAARFYRINI